MSPRERVRIEWQPKRWPGDDVFEQVEINAHPNWRGFQVSLAPPTIAGAASEAEALELAWVHVFDGGVQLSLVLHRDELARLVASLETAIVAIDARRPAPPDDVRDRTGAH